MLQKSNDEQKHGGSTEDMVTRASLEDDIRRMTENFEDEGAWLLMLDGWTSTGS